MADRNKTMARIVFLNGRIDACEKMVDELSARINADREIIARLQGELKEIVSGATQPAEASQENS